MATRFLQESVALPLTIHNLLLTINKLLQFVTIPRLIRFAIAAGSPDLQLSGGTLCADGSGLQQFRVSPGQSPSGGCAAWDPPGRAVAVATAEFLSRFLTKSASSLAYRPGPAPS